MNQDWKLYVCTQTWGVVSLDNLSGLPIENDKVLVEADGRIAIEWNDIHTCIFCKWTSIFWLDDILIIEGSSLSFESFKGFFHIPNCVSFYESLLSAAFN